MIYYHNYLIDILFMINYFLLLIIIKKLVNKILFYHLTYLLLKYNS